MSAERDSDQTRRTFSDKWTNNPNLAFEQTLREGSEIQRWILTRNGFADRAAFREFLRDRKRILDAGCGNGRVTALLSELAPHAEIAGVDLVSADVAATNLADRANVRILERDLLADLTDLGAFDFIYAQEVLHHTTDPRGAFLNLAQRLAPGGAIAIYVYKKKAPVRELTDDYVRDAISSLPYEEAMAACEQITRLGKALSEAAMQVEVPAVPILGIGAGVYDIQRFLYHHFVKCFWNPELSFEENVVINYDWYHPQLCSRHTPDEVRGWFEAAGLRVVHEHTDFYGITMRGERTC